MVNYFQKLLEENQGDEDVGQDMMIARVQSDYYALPGSDFKDDENVRNLVGYYSEAALKVKDDKIRQVINNNLIYILLRGGVESEGVADLLKRLDVSHAQETGITPEQKQLLLLNRAIVNLVNNRFTESETILHDIETAATGAAKEELLNDETFVFAKFYLAYRRRNVGEVETLASNLLKQSGGSAKVARLVHFAKAEVFKQLNQQAKYLEALKALIISDRSVLENEVVSTFLITLIARDPAALQELKSFLYEATKTSNSSALLSLVCHLLFEEKQYSTAVDILAKLVKKDPSDQKTLMKYVFALSFVDPEKAESLIKQLPQVDLITDSLTLTRLENEPLSFRKLKETRMAEASKRIKKIKRRIKWPRGFDPANPGPTPDPERWLPKYQRSKYRKKGKGLKGAQGGDAGRETTNTFQTGPSTALHEAATAKTTTTKKKKKK
eukprot:TRINITY_DN3032_c0_g4_i1.p1 TRINITY_DN3032_c0_g4~~TRINITY_DN3032_c0_g4_i1.p1  ORF type:complete len:441 (-),score=172.88 TRINITY_DN3032_c0_g4_i1:192-1514(-)